MAGRAVLLAAVLLVAATEPGSSLVTQHRLTVRVDDGLLAPDADDACRLVADAEVNHPSLAHLFNEAAARDQHIHRAPMPRTEPSGNSYIGDLNFARGFRATDEKHADEAMHHPLTFGRSCVFIGGRSPFVSFPVFTPNPVPYREKGGGSESREADQDSTGRARRSRALIMVRA